MKKLITLLTICLTLTASALEMSFTPKFYLGLFVDHYRTVTFPSIQDDRAGATNHLYAGKYRNKPLHTDYGAIKSKLGMDIKIGDWTLYCDNTIYMTPKGLSGFAPRSLDCVIGLKYGIWEKLTVSAEHLCQHPVLDANINDSPSVYGAYTVVALSWGY